MDLVDLERFKDTVNRDPEFKIAARFWDGTVKVGMGEHTLILKIKDGVLQDVLEPAGSNLMVVMREYDIEVSAPEAEWVQFLQEKPRRFYHDLFAAVVRHDFTWGGDMQMWFAYYGALRRMFELMRGSAKVPQEAS